jgi:hypothetical protein
MKRNYLVCLALLCSTWAWADNAFSIDDFTIAAGEEKAVDIKMYNDVNIAAFQFVLALPEGVSITKVTATNRLKKWDDDEEAYVPVHTVSTLSGSGTYKVMAYAMPSTDIAGTSGDAVVKIKFKASDQISTGPFTLAITDQEMTEANGTKHVISASSYKCSVTLNTTVTSLGYASFSWPKALDFTSSGLTAYIATSCDGSTVHLEPVTKVPANTGLILKGSVGDYSLSTTTDTPDDVSGNLLISNTVDQYTVSGSNIFVLSNMDGYPGFYPAQTGVNIAKYKSYLAYSAGARKFLSFDDNTTGIENTYKAETDSEGQYFNLQGQRVNTPAKGVYIVDGKKYIAK